MRRQVLSSITKFPRSPLQVCDRVINFLILCKMNSIKYVCNYSDWSWMIEWRGNWFSFMKYFCHYSGISFHHTLHSHSSINSDESVGCSWWRWCISDDNPTSHSLHSNKQESTDKDTKSLQTVGNTGMFISLISESVIQLKIPTQTRLCWSVSAALKYW